MVDGNMIKTDNAEISIVKVDSKFYVTVYSCGFHITEWYSEVESVILYLEVQYGVDKDTIRTYIDTVMEDMTLEEANESYPDYDFGGEDDDEDDD